MVRSLDDAVDARWPDLGPAEQRVARFFRANREEVLVASAAELAERAGTSDATVVRAAKALGFEGLGELRRIVAGELRRSLSQMDRLRKTIDEVGREREGALGLTLDLHLQAIGQIRHSVTPALYDKAVQRIRAAKTVHVFGIGPSSAMADYFVTQLTRFGIPAHGLTSTGLLFADDLQHLRRGDCVIILAYGRVYAELDVLLDRIERLRLRSILVTDSLADILKKRVYLVLPVPRGHAELFSMHTATLGLIEALLVGIAATRPKESLRSLALLNEAREKLAGSTVKLRR
jgi:DNA-binding MurR/RpiR family transcriptional regulator